MKAETRQYKISNKLLAGPKSVSGLQEAITGLSKVLSGDEVEEILFKKLKVDVESPSGTQFYQYACEVAICAYFARFYNEGFLYEPKLNPPKDVDCSFLHSGLRFNVEVKCADFSKKHLIDAGVNFQIGSLGRLTDFQDLVEKLTPIMQSGEQGRPLVKKVKMDNKMKDYLEGAHAKFSSEEKSDEVNILVVCCDGVSDFNDWIFYLIGQQGLFTEHSFCDPKSYSRVHAVLLTNLYHRLRRCDEAKKIDHCWRFDEAFNLLLFNPARKDAHERVNSFIPVVRMENIEYVDFTVPGVSDRGVAEGLKLFEYVRTQFEKGIFRFEPISSD